MRWDGWVRAGAQCCTCPTAYCCWELGGAGQVGVSPTLHPSSTAVTQALTSSSLACLAELWEGHAGGQLLRDICHAAGMSKRAKLGTDVLPP